jgi:formate hydrogenlyase transcriptional activator
MVLALDRKRSADSPTGWVVQTQAAARRPDTSVETRFKEMTLIRQDGIESFCVLPLTTAHKRLGALGFGRRQRAAYPADEVQFLGQVAKLVAVAIENAVAFGRSRAQGQARRGATLPRE